MYILKDVDFSKLIKRNVNEKHTLLIEYLDLNGTKQKKNWKNNGKDIYLEGIKELIKARVGYDKAWKNVLDIVKKKMLVEEKGLTKEFYITNKTLLFYFGFNLNLTSCNTVMASNYLNRLMKNNNKIILLSPFKIENSFLQNLVFKRYTIIECTEENHKKLFKNYEKTCDLIFIRQLKNINSLKGESYLKKTIIYEVGDDLKNIKELNNEFHSIITQGEKLKKTIKRNGVHLNKIKIIEPFVYKYALKKTITKQDNYVFGYIGPINENSQIEMLIDQFNKVTKEKYNCKLIIINNDDNANLTKSIFFNKIKVKIVSNDNIRFLQNLSSRDKFDILNDYMDILCVPSIKNNRESINIFNEVFYNKILLCPDVEIIKPMIIDNKNSILFSNNNEYDLYIKLIDILNNKYNFGI